MAWYSYRYDPSESDDPATHAKIVARNVSASTEMDAIRARLAPTASEIARRARA